MINYINEYIEPGVYEHYKGGIYVLLDVITHMENPSVGKIERLAEPLVVYRDLTQILEHDKNGKPCYPHKRYCRTISDFKAMVMHDGNSVKRFKKI